MKRLFICFLVLLCVTGPCFSVAPASAAASDGDSTTITVEVTLDDDLAPRRTLEVRHADVRLGFFKSAEESRWTVTIGRDGQFTVSGEWNLRDGGVLFGLDLNLGNVPITWRRNLARGSNQLQVRFRWP